MLPILATCTLLLADPLLPPPAAASEHAERRARAVEALRKAGGDAATMLLRAPEVSRFTSDVDYPYRPDNGLFYLTGIDEPGVALLLSVPDLEGGGHEVFFFTPRDPAFRVWVGDPLTVEEAISRSGLARSAVIDASELPARLARAGLARSRGHHGGPGGASKRTFYFDAGPGFQPGKSPSEPYGFLLSALGSDAFHLEVRPPSDLLDRLRQLKSPSEIALLEKAIDATARAQLRAWRALKPGIREFEVRAVIEETFVREGCKGWSFPPIVGTGPNTCVLHYERYDRKTEDGDLAVLDIGGEYGYYSADVTRTVPVNGKFTPRQREVYEAVLAAQDAGIRAARPGARHREVHEAASREVAAGLKRFGLIHEDGEVHKYFPHGTSHGLGLDVHDPMPDEVLRPGMVITVEPGIYIAGESLGVRIEDDVLITEDGCRVLSSGAPRSVEEIEGFMSGREF